MNRFIVLMSFTLIAACSSSNVRNSLALEPGMNKGAVINAMGTPDNRSFRGTDEAWQYQQVAGFGQCSYITVWFHESAVLGVTSRNGPSVAGCGLGSSEVDWGQIPTPTSTLNVNIKTQNQ